jgi:glycosyltransferase involved in cell wall biosynthesis
MRSTVILSTHFSNPASVAAPRFHCLADFLHDSDIDDILVLSHNKDAIHDYDKNLNCRPIGGKLLGEYPQAFAAIILLLTFLLNSAIIIKIFRFLWTSNAFYVASQYIDISIAKGQTINLISSYSPVDTLLTGFCLKLKYPSLHLISDFRDGLVFEPLGRNSSLTITLKKLIEEKIYSSSCHIVTVSKPLFDFYCQSYNNSARIHLIYNGYINQVHRPEYNSNKTISSCPQPPYNKYQIGYIGRISKSDKSSYISFLILCNFLANNASLVQHLNISFTFVGDFSHDELSQIIKLQQIIEINLYSFMNKQDLSILARECSAFLLLTGDRTSVVTGKIFDYFAYGKPIICVTTVHNDACHLIDEYNAGLWCLSTEPSFLPDFRRILLTVTGNCKFYSNGKNVAIFDRRNQVNQWTNLLT